MRLLIACLAVAAGLLPTTAAAQSSIFFVRHAERADSGAAAKETDPALSAAGRARAESLATVLKDAGITAIFTTEYQRTKQTAAPLAKALGLDVVVVPGKDVAGLVDRLKAAKGNALVVGHSNTVPDALKLLGVKDAVAIGDDEFDHLLIAVRDGGTTLVRLRYK